MGRAPLRHRNALDDGDVMVEHDARRMRQDYFVARGEFEALREGPLNQEHACDVVVHFLADARL